MPRLHQPLPDARRAYPGADGRYQEGHEGTVLGQLVNLRTRARLVRAMQALGVARSGCVFCMSSLLCRLTRVAQGVFALNPVLLTVSLVPAVWD